MSTLLPDTPEAPSGWNTPNHYFYETVNRDGESVRIQLSFSAHNIPDGLRAQCERIDALTHSGPIPDGWQWRVTFKTPSVPVAGLDKCLDGCGSSRPKPQIKAFYAKSGARTFNIQYAPYAGEYVAAEIL